MGVKAGLAAGGLTGVIAGSLAYIHLALMREVVIEYLEEMMEELMARYGEAIGGYLSAESMYRMALASSFIGGVVAMLLLGAVLGAIMGWRWERIPGRGASKGLVVGLAALAVIEGLRLLALHLTAPSFTAVASLSRAAPSLRRRPRVPSSVSVARGRGGQPIREVVEELAMEAVYRLVGVSKVYRSGSVETVALRGPTSRCMEEYLAMGVPHARGKSTLLNITGPLDRPTSGKVCLEGRDVTELSDEEASRLRSRRIGFIFQTFNLIPWLTALENVELAASIAGGGLGSSSRWWA